MQDPLIRQSEHHDSGWGMAVYDRADGAAPRVMRIPEAAHAGQDFAAAIEATGRSFNSERRPGAGRPSTAARSDLAARG